MKKSIEKFVKNKVSFNKIFVQQNTKKERKKAKNFLKGGKTKKGTTNKQTDRQRETRNGWNCDKILAKVKKLFRVYFKI